jgi:hypothetical protein
MRSMISYGWLRERCASVARAAPMPTWDAAAQAFLDVFQMAA